MGPKPCSVPVNGYEICVLRPAPHSQASLRRCAPAGSHGPTGCGLPRSTVPIPASVPALPAIPRLAALPLAEEDCLGHKPGNRIPREVGAWSRLPRQSWCARAQKEPTGLPSPGSRGPQTFAPARRVLQGSGSATCAQVFCKPPDLKSDGDCWHKNEVQSGSRLDLTKISCKTFSE